MYFNSCVRALTQLNIARRGEHCRVGEESWLLQMRRVMKWSSVEVEVAHDYVSTCAAVDNAINQQARIYHEHAQRDTGLVSVSRQSSRRNAII